MDVIKEGLLKVDPGLLLWTIITFAVLLLLMWKFAWRPIVDALDARAEKIRGDIENAEKSNKDAQALLDDHKKMMDSAREEAAIILTKGKEDAERLKNDIVDKANKEAKELIDRARREIDLAKENAIADLKNEIVTISTDIASKVIGKNINADDQKTLVEEALDKMRTVQ